MKTLILASILALSACTATVGPYVTDVEKKEDGSLRVQRCKQDAVVFFDHLVIDPRSQCAWEDKENGQQKK